MAQELSKKRTGRQMVNIAAAMVVFLLASACASSLYMSLSGLAAKAVFLKVGIWVITLLCFYFLFILIAILFYRGYLAAIGSSEGTVDMRQDRAQWQRQLHRIMLDGLIVDFAYPMMHMFPDTMKLMRCRIGKNVVLAGRIASADLVTIGDDTVIGYGAFITSHVSTGPVIIHRKVTIGKNCTIGVRAIIFPGAHIGDNSIIAPGSVVTPDTVIPPQEIWAGVPSKKLKDNTDY